MNPSQTPPAPALPARLAFPLAGLFLAAAVPHASGQGAAPSFAVERVNLTSVGSEYSESFSLGHPSISADGRYVVFISLNALVPEDTNGMIDVYLRDRVSGTTHLVSLTSTGGIAQGGGSYNAKISADGSAVAFVSTATNLVTGDTNGLRDVFVRDFAALTTTRVSVGPAGVQANNGSGDSSVASRDLSISDNGRYVVFRSDATNLVAGDANGVKDAFLHDRVGGTTTRVSVGTGGGESGWEALDVAVSGDGSKVAFVSRHDFGGNPSNAVQVWLRDLAAGTTELVSKSDGGAAGNGSSYAPDLSFDGRRVVFDSVASNLATPSSSSSNIYLRDRQSGTTSLVSVTTTGAAAGDSQLPTITANGRYVSFASFSNQLVLGDTNSAFDVFVRDLQTGRTGIVSRTSAFLQSNGVSNRPAIADDTLEVVFESYANNLVPNDTNAKEDLFVAAPAFPSTVLINELDAVTDNGRQFIELYDGGAGSTDLTGLVVVLYDGATDTSYGAFDLDGHSTDADGYFVIGTASVPGVDLVAANGFLQAGVDAVALYYDNASSFPNGSPVTVNRLRDALVHENSQPNDMGLLALLQNTGQPQADEAANGRAATESVQRLPNGAGLPGVTGVFQAYAPSPGGPNGVPAALGLDPASDSGISDSDGITKDTTPTITGLAPVGSTVSLVSSLAGPVGTAVASASGAWSVTPASVLGEGTHLFTASADGGPSSAALSVTIDTTAPAAPSSLALSAESDTGASSSDRVTADNTPTITGEAEASASVTITSDLDGVVGTTPANSPWSIDCSTLRDGVHQLTATATDPAGNVSSASAALSVTIDTLRPSVTVNRAVGQADPAGGAPVEFDIVFDEAVSGLLVGDFVLAGTAGPGSPALSGGASAYTFTVGSVGGEGTVTLSLPAEAAEDLAGNTSLASSSTDNVVEIDLHGGDAGSASMVPLAAGIGSLGGWLGAGDLDVFSFTLATPQRVALFTMLSVDTLGVLRDAGGAVLNVASADDDRGGGGNFRIERTLAPGTYFVEVSGKGAAATGAYTLAIDAAGAPLGRPDLLVGRSLATAVGGNRYGAGQLVTIVSRRAVRVSGIVAVENDGEIDDSFRLRGSRGNTLFAVAYFRGAGNITAQMLAGTAPSGILSPGPARHLVSVKITPNRRKINVRRSVRGRIVTITQRRTLNLAVSAVSELQPTARDAGTIRVRTQ